MINRYFIVKTEHLPHNLSTHYIGEYHYIDLPDGHHCVVVFGNKEVPEEWQALPHILDSCTLKPEHCERLAHLGINPEDRGFTIAKTLSKMHPAFKP
jgi:hypothetical protein